MLHGEASAKPAKNWVFGGAKVHGVARAGPEWAADPVLTVLEGAGYANTKTTALGLSSQQNVSILQTR